MHHQYAKPPMTQLEIVKVMERTPELLGEDVGKFVKVVPSPNEEWSGMTSCMIDDFSEHCLENQINER